VATRQFKALSAAAAQEMCGRGAVWFGFGGASAGGGPFANAAREGVSFCLVLLVLAVPTRHRDSVDRPRRW